MLKMPYTINTKFVFQAHCRPGGPTAAGVTKTTSRSSVSSSVGSIGGLGSPTEETQKANYPDPSLPTEHGYTHPTQAPPAPRRDSQSLFKLLSFKLSPQKFSIIILNFFCSFSVFCNKRRCNSSKSHTRQAELSVTNRRRHRGHHEELKKNFRRNIRRHVIFLFCNRSL